MKAIKVSAAGEGTVNVWQFIQFLFFDVLQIFKTTAHFNVNNFRLIGPSHWGEQYNTCFGKFQSPIDINSLTVKHARLPRLQFHDIDVPSNQTILKNNGHTGE